MGVASRLVKLLLDAGNPTLRHQELFEHLVAAWQLPHGHSTMPAPQPHPSEGDARSPLAGEFLAVVYLVIGCLFLAAIAAVTIITCRCMNTPQKSWTFWFQTSRRAPRRDG